MPIEKKWFNYLLREQDQKLMPTTTENKVVNLLAVVEGK